MAEHNRRFDRLTPGQDAALRRWARIVGRFWKRELLVAWERDTIASYLPMPNANNDQALLRGLRNSHGPMWLASFTLKRARRPDAGIPMRSMRDFDRL